MVPSYIFSALLACTEICPHGTCHFRQTVSCLQEETDQWATAAEVASKEWTGSLVSDLVPCNNPHAVMKSLFSKWVGDYPEKP